MLIVETWDKIKTISSFVQPLNIFDLHREESQKNIGWLQGRISRHRKWNENLMCMIEESKSAQNPYCIYS